MSDHDRRHADCPDRTVATHGLGTRRHLSRSGRVRSFMLTGRVARLLVIRISPGSSIRLVHAGLHCGVWRSRPWSGAVAFDVLGGEAGSLPVAWSAHHETVVRLGAVGESVLFVRELGSRPQAVTRGEDLHDEHDAEDLPRTDRVARKRPRRLGQMACRQATARNPGMGALHRPGWKRPGRRTGHRRREAQVPPGSASPETHRCCGPGCSRRQRCHRRWRSCH